MGTRPVTAPTIAVTLLAGAVFRPLGASAQPAAVRIAYAAGEDCPGRDQFAASVAARGRIVVAVAGDSPSAMRVTIVAERAGGYRGTLQMGLSDEGKREVRGGNCREVVDALAVVTVSSLGPTEANAASATRIEVPANPATPEATAVEPATPPVLVTPRVHAETGNIGTPPKELAVGAGTLRFDRDISMTAFGGVATGFVPSVVLPRFDFEVARTNLVTSPEGHSYRVVPTVRLHWTVFGTGEYRSSYGTTEANALALGADICSPLYYDRTGLAVLFCAELMAGYFGVRTTSVQGVQGPDKIMGFGTAGFGLDLAYNFGRHFHLGLKLGAAVVMGGVLAEASDGSEIFKSSPFSLHGMIGAGGHF
jgi:hypothetical protein